MILLEKQWIEEIKSAHAKDSNAIDKAMAAWSTTDRINIVEHQAGQGLAVATEVLTNSQVETLFVHLGDVRDADDLLLCLSEALPGPTWGKAIQTQAQLNDFNGNIVLYGADRKVLDGLEMVKTFEAPHKWILISDHDLEMAEEDTVYCAKSEHLVDVEDAPDDSVKALAYLPAGLDEQHAIPKPLRLPWPNQLHVLRWDVALKIREKSSLNESAKHIANHLNQTLSFSESAAMPIQESTRKLFTLRWLSEISSIPEQSLKAAISYSRLRTVLGQPEKALTALEAARKRDPNMPPRLNIMLHWSASQAHAQMGDLRLMYHTSQMALDAARAAQDIPAEMMILKTRSEMRRLWGDLAGAKKDANTAMKRIEDSRYEVSKSAIFRNLAEIAVVEKEYFKAMSLLEQAQVQCNSPIEHVNRQLAISGIRLESGDIQGAKAALSTIEKTAEKWPILKANLHRRKTEVSLALKNKTEALKHADEALKGYRMAGKKRESSTMLRLKADIMSLLGDRKEALEVYRKCLREQAAIGDGHGLQKTLSHILMIMMPGKLKDELKIIRDKFIRFDFGELTENVINWASLSNHE